MAAPEPKRATELECPSAGSTHHMTPTGPARAREMRCAYCKMTQKEIES